MASFEVAVRTIEISPHPNADAIELANVFGYQAVVGKGQFVTGDKIIYIPEQALVPEKLLQHMQLEGKLKGSKKNRVGAIKLRGALSQGLCLNPKGLQELYPDTPLPSLEEGTDWKEFLGIEKYVQEIPAKFAGVWKTPEEQDVQWFRGYTDIENIKRYPNVIEEGEAIVCTEKAHGTNICISLINNNFYVSSKGISHKGMHIAEDEANVYWRAVRKYNLEELLRKLQQREGIMSDFVRHEITLFGEVLGVQDLKYGATTSDPGFRAFDIRINGRYLNYNKFVDACEFVGIIPVPVLYNGNSIAEGLTYTTGTTLIDGCSHIREGIVIKPAVERIDRDLGRIILKSISPDYLTRKGDVTEYE